MMQSQATSISNQIAISKRIVNIKLKHTQTISNYGWLLWRCKGISVELQKMGTSQKPAWIREDWLTGCLSSTGRVAEPQETTVLLKISPNWIMTNQSCGDSLLEKGLWDIIGLSAKRKTDCTSKYSCGFHLGQLFGTGTDKPQKYACLPIY